MFYFFVSPSHQQAVNPCVALKLPLCRVKQEFAEEHGIRTEKPKSTPTRSRLVVQPEENPSKPIQRINTPNAFTREGDTIIVTPSPTPTRSRVVPENNPSKPKQPLRSSPPQGGGLRASALDRFRERPSKPPPPRTTSTTSFNSGTNNDACRGLRFCVLKNRNSGDSINRRRPATARTTTTTETPDIFEQILAGTFGNNAAAPDPGNSFDNSGNLLDLVLRGELDEAKRLIENGADVRAEDQHGNSVLHIAAQNGRTGIVEDLILGGADVNKGNNHKNTALHLAAQNGWSEIARILLTAKKINVNYKDLHANTALHLAAQNGQLGVAEHLIEAGANLNAPNAHKHIPLHLAAQNGHMPMTKVLVDGGSDLNFPDLIGNTPLHTAVHNSHTEIAKYLVASGADEFKRNLSGLTPFQLVGK